MLTVRTLAWACALALVPFASVAHADGIALPKGVTAGSCVEGICEYRLANGLQVLLFPDASKPTVTVNVTYHVGSANENYGETGMAHLLEHMVFKGTPDHKDIPGGLRKLGAAYNGQTSLDRTNYFASFPANDASLEWMLAMEADRMVNSFVAKKDLDSEMTVVRNEMESRENDPGSVFMQRMQSASFQWHNYGHSTIGNRSDVENVPIANLQAFYRAWYQPDNATLIMAGRFDPSKTLTLINADFGKIKRPTRTLPTSYTLEPVQDGEREITVRRSGDVRLVGLNYHMPAATHPDTAALTVLANILADVPGGRLYKLMVNTKLAAFTSTVNAVQHDPSRFTLLAVVPKDGDPAKTEAELLKQAESIAAVPVTAQELADAKQRFANSYELAFNNPNAIGLALSESIAAGDWRLWFVQRDAIARVTLADVNRVAAKYLIQSNRTLARFIPTDNAVRADTGGAPSVASLVDGYKGHAAVAAGETFDPTPQNIAARTEIITIGDGLKVSLLPKKTRGGTVVVSASFHFNDVNALKSVPRVVPDMTGAMLMRGSKTMTREQIDKRFEALKTSAGVAGSGQGASIGLQTRRGELVDALTLAADILHNPVFPESEFEQIRLQSETNLEAARKEPGTLTGQALAAHFDPWPVDHPLHHRTLDESLADLKAVKLDDVRRFHQQYYGTSQGEIAIVGDFDPATIKPLLQKLFADWKPRVTFEPISTHYKDVASEHRNFETPDKSNAVFVAHVNLPLNDDDPDLAALEAANQIFGGGGGLKSRLADRVRQKDGLSYTIGSGLNADMSRDGKDDAGSFSIQAIAAPQNIAKVEADVREELDRLIRDGVTAEELADTVSGLLTQREQGRASDGSVAAMLNSDQRYDRKMLRRAEFDAKLKALTVADVNAAIRKHFKPMTAMSVYVAGDFANAAKKAAPAPTSSP
ncbi:M16 family metallopeptidase [Solilutibacter silvestris]|uniref:Peptidase M16 inactive domain n=1 Tax=Solilutibacter silvestris TaxID=1645665 RepID=A0A2K1Q0U0_9GAMM|nr:pitrilysin family protein [Lysobacter silvestris]PNS08656.1 Peptidase M16 inactive domain [Lysobacter silvestris]